MPTWGYDGSGNFRRRHDWTDDAAAGIKILSLSHDEEDDNFASGLSNAICRDGQTPIGVDIPWNGKRITNLGDPRPTAPQDAATKNYVDTLQGWTTSKYISGADTQGRLNFTSGTGANGVSWTAANMSLISRAAVTNQTQQRVVFNGSSAGTGTDVIRFDRSGMVASSWLISLNSMNDGTNWRTIAPGYVGGINPGGNSITFYGSDTATTTAYQTATMRKYAMAYPTAGDSRFDLYTTAGNYNAFAGYVNGAPRWLIMVGNGAGESGSNAGSDFQIVRYSDGGTGLGAALTIDRSSGAVSIAKPTGSYALSAYGPSGAGGTIGYCSNPAYYGITGYQTVAGVAYSFYGNGNAYNSSAWTTSDGRLKSNLAALDPVDALSKVRAINVLSYTKQGAAKTERGWLAQDVEALIPEAVLDVEIPQGDTETRAALGGGNTVKATNDRTMLATLWAAVQQQAAIIEALQAKVAALEAAP